MSCFPPHPYPRRGKETLQRYKLFLCFTILCQKKWRGGVEIGNKNKLSFNLFMDEVDEMSANNIREIYSL